VSDTHEFLSFQINFIQDFLRKEMTAEVIQKSRNRPVQEINNIQWLVGHINWCKDILICEWAGGDPIRTKEWDQWFALGSEKSDSNSIPDVEIIMDEINNNHEYYLKQIKAMDLKKKPKINPEFFPSNLALVIHYISDARYHCGQVSHLAKWLSAH